MRSFQDLISSKKNLVEYLYNDTDPQMMQSQRELFASKGLIKHEYTSWRDEHRAARDTCILANQSHHMPVLYVKGPDAKKLLQYLTPISLSNIAPDRAKQYFAITPRGHHIGDCILFYYGEDDGFELISGMPVLNWVRFHAETGDYRVEVRFDPTTPFNPTGKRTKFRFQVEGPTAGKVLDEAVEGGWSDPGFFRIANVTIAGCPVQALRHSMATGGGAELSGPYDQLDAVRDALMKVGEKHGIRLAGTRTYFSNSLRSGWVPYPLPGIFTGDDLRAYREWLPADCWEANMQIGGSLYSQNIEDYYWTPSALGYDRLVKFDHDFIGRQALEAAEGKPRRVKRILRWSKDDISRVNESQFSEGPIFKAIDLPSPMFGWPQADEIRSLDGKVIGMSQQITYSLAPRDMISVCSIDEEHATIGSEVLISWGEPNGGSRKLHVEPHAQTTIRATVFEAPYTKVIEG